MSMPAPSRPAFNQGMHPIKVARFRRFDQLWLIHQLFLINR